ncbi:MAG: MoaD/ThiS family protein [Sphingobacteriales bacterium]|nr:MoaD/ThiS family protein [Sphingobacteriales bacterium]MBI3717681.1 MoaD/ThiS family protein [Sphingobacteriales bacterium]
MAINIVIFGSLTDITGSTLQLENIADTNALVSELNNRYPVLVNSKFMIAVNKKMIDTNTPLNNNDTIALLPPFSGG